MTVPFCKDCVHYFGPLGGMEYAGCTRKGHAETPYHTLASPLMLWCDTERSKWWPSCGKKGRYFVAKEKVK